VSVRISVPARMSMLARKTWREVKRILFLLKAADFRSPGEALLFVSHLLINL
jgi:hypothetical protein